MKPKIRRRLARRIRRANLYQRPREAGSGAGARCLAQQRPCAGDEAGAGCHAAAGDRAAAGARTEPRYWLGSLVKSWGFELRLSVRFFKFHERTTREAKL